MADCLCDQCSALCCRYFALPIDNPESARQYDDIRWYLCHENVVVFIEEKQWYIGFMSRCKHLQDDNRCGIYQTRPKICREYSTDNCDFHGGEYNFEQLFTSAEQLHLYAKEQLAKQKRNRRPGRRKSSRRPPPRRLVSLKPSFPSPPYPANGNGTGNGRRLSLPQIKK